MRRPLIIDGRRLLPYAQFRSMGYVVERIGDGVDGGGTGGQEVESGNLRAPLLKHVRRRSHPVKASRRLPAGRQKSAWCPDNLPFAFDWALAYVPESGKLISRPK
jgi:hypothetical protein